MPILDSEVLLLASARMTDYADGGGPITSEQIVDNVDNNVFNDVTDIDRLTGRLQLRKLFGAATNNDTDAYLSAFVLVDKAPGDPSVSGYAFTYGGLTTERAAAQAQIDTSGLVRPVLDFSANLIVEGTATPGSAVTTGSVKADWTEFDAYKGVFLVCVNGTNYTSDSIGPGVQACVRGLLSRSGGTLTWNAPIPFAGLVEFTPIVVDSTLSTVEVVSCVPLSAAAAAAATSVTLGDTFVNVVPHADGLASPPTPQGVSVTRFRASAGKYPVVRPSMLMLLHDTDSPAPVAVSNGATVSAGRTNLARLRVIGSNGVAHATFHANQAAPIGVGCTANLAAGTVTFSDVSGMMQPVIIEDRIEELVQVRDVSHGTRVVELTLPLTRAFPITSKLSGLAQLGDLQGRVVGGFAQQSWTGLWADVLSGAEPTADFDKIAYPIEVTNKGTVTERWVIIFQSASTFRVIAEGIGEIGTGNTGVDYAPVNPATGVPYFTIPVAGWGVGWAAGNVYRFNTIASHAPVWAAMCVSPSAPGGDDSISLQLRGYVNV